MTALEILFSFFSKLSPKILDIFGLDEKMIKMLHQLKIFNLIDLLKYKPKNYIIKKINPIFLKDQENVIMQIKILSIQEQSKCYIVKAESLKQKNQIIELVFFKKKLKFLKIGNIYTVDGKISIENNNYKIIHPDFIFNFESKYLNKLKTILNSDNFQDVANNFTQEIYPVYCLTYGLTNIMLRNSILEVLLWIKENFNTIKHLNLPRPNLLNFWQSLKTIHVPIDFHLLKQSIYRLSLDEILSHKILLNSINNYNIKQKIISKSNLQDLVLNDLNFSLTLDQEKVLNEILHDQTNQNKKMTRLLQGDVGSGKTLVALLSSLNVIIHNLNLNIDTNIFTNVNDIHKQTISKPIPIKQQVAILVPLDILANQHFNLFKILEKYGFKVELLTSKITNSKKQQIIKDLKLGKIDILIGTHSILEPDVQFFNLIYTVIDEQQRFGVLQRAEMIKKGTIDLLMMTATPIPRTLQISYFGDIDVSIMKNKIKNRKEIITSVMTNAGIPQLLNRLHQHLLNDGKIYWICALKNKTEDTNESNDNFFDKKFEIQNAQDRFEQLSEYFDTKVAKNEEIFKKIQIHQLTSSTSRLEKQKIFDQFKASKAQILVATTVIEVGVDVPDASIIIIEDSQQFGLAQLHQLRGRVGRGSVQSFCILLYNPFRTSNMAKNKLNILKQHLDGFIIAEEDLKLRGSGEIIGFKQTGEEIFYFFDHTDISLQTEEFILQIKSDFLLYLQHKNNKYEDIYKFMIKFFAKNDILLKEDLILN